MLGALVLSQWSTNHIVESCTWITHSTLLLVFYSIQVHLYVGILILCLPYIVSASRTFLEQGWEGDGKIIVTTHVILLMIYEINHIWTAEMKWKWRNDRRSERNLCNCVKKPGKKKFRPSTGFEPETSPLPVRCSTNWAWLRLILFV